jgi:hypothetical protein
MHPDQFRAGDGVSAPGIPSRLAPIPKLVVCLVSAQAQSMTPQSTEQIYALALEWAQFAIRPSAYELAARVCAN